MYLFLKKLEKGVSLGLAETVPENLSFLPSINNATIGLPKTGELVVSLNTSQKKLDQLRYETRGDGLDIFIVPKQGSFEEKDISFRPGVSGYDLIIILGCPDLEYLGKLYEENTELFFNTPLINIDYHSSNENFGQVNLVEITASSTAEIMVNLIESLNNQLIDEEIATCLLTGIISQTDNFQKTNTRPRTFTTAASLIARGADHQKIIRFLYKTTSLAALKLWGRVMARLSHDPDYRLAWSLIPFEDFQKTGAKASDAFLALNKLTNYSPDSDIFFLLLETANRSVEGLAQTVGNIETQQIANLLGGKASGQRIIFKTANYNLRQAEKEILDKIKTALRQYFQK